MTSHNSQFRDNHQCKQSQVQQNHQKSASLGKKRKTGGKQKNYSEDELFEPDYHTMKKLKFPINRQRLNMGNWSLEENRVYLSFLKNNRQSFVDESTRRQDRVFCRLSELLKKKRTPDQCRSHHQKLIGKLNNSFDDLIKKMQKKIERKYPNISNTSIKIQEQLFQPLKIEEEKQKETGLPDTYLSPNPQLQQATKQIRLPEKTIERDFYKLATYKSQALIQIWINEEKIKIY